MASRLGKFGSSNARIARIDPVRLWWMDGRTMQDFAGEPGFWPTRFKCPVSKPTLWNRFRKSASEQIMKPSNTAQFRFPGTNSRSGFRPVWNCSWISGDIASTGSTPSRISCCSPWTPSPKSANQKKTRQVGKSFINKGIDLKYTIAARNPRWLGAVNLGMDGLAARLFGVVRLS